MKNKWLIIAVLFPVLSFSQGNVSRGEFTAITSVGFAGGESTAKPLYQVSAGITFDQWFTGIGFGFDQYRFGSFPLFADLRLNFGKAKLGFVYANGGYNFPGKHTGDGDNFFKTTDRLLGGFYMDAGIGYRIRLNPLHRILFSAGYSQKNVTNKIGYTYPCLVAPCPEDIYDYRYQLGRIVTKISWEFGRSK
ncbi:MAG TPA: hypothetical protein VIZ28_03565 [Chitinophagaceae bacterium]